MINLQNLKKTYQSDCPVFALRGIDLTVKDGEILAILGSTGSGKSTLLNVIGLMEQYDEGEYYFDEYLIKHLNNNKAAEIRNGYIGYVHQHADLISYKNAIENLSLALYDQSHSKKRRHEIALEYLNSFNLKQIAYLFPHEMDLIQQRKLCFVRALISTPKIILADEPIESNDADATKEMISFISNLNKKTNTTIVLTTKNRSVAEQAHRFVKLKEGLVMN